eukprot:52130_1
MSSVRENEFKQINGMDKNNKKVKKYCCNKCKKVFNRNVKATLLPHYKLCTGNKDKYGDDGKLKTTDESDTIDKPKKKRKKIKEKEKEKTSKKKTPKTDKKQTQKKKKKKSHRREARNETNNYVDDSDKPFSRANVFGPTF